MEESQTSTDDKPSRPRRKFRRWLLLAGFLGLLAWINGPGLRWLALMTAQHFLKKIGLQSEFTLEGSLVGGLAISNLRISSDQTLANVTVKRARPSYQLSELLRGRFRGIEIEGAHVDLRLGVSQSGNKSKKPLDLDALVKSLRQTRSRILPYAIELRDITLTVSRNDERWLALGKSSLIHRPGTADIALDLGPLTDHSGRSWPSQQVTLAWDKDHIMFDRIDPLPGVSVRDLMVSLPESGGPSADAEVRFEEAVFVLSASPGFSSVGIEMREGRLDSRKLADYLGVDPPASGELTSLSLILDELLPNPKSAIGSARFLLENVAYGEWSVSELSVDASLQADRATLTAGGRALDTGFSITAEAPVSRSAGALIPGDIRGKFHVMDVSALASAFAQRVPAMDDTYTAPQAVAGGSFTLVGTNFRPVSAEVDLMVTPANPNEASTLALKSRWHDHDQLRAEMEAEGMKVTIDHDLTKVSYQVVAAFDSFRSARIDRWLEIFRAGTQGAYAGTADASGSGDMKSNKHQGRISVSMLDLALPGRPTLQVQGDLAYDWPAAFTTENLSIRSGDQSITANLRMADGLFIGEKLLWTQGEREIAKGAVSMPVPANFSKWRETLAHDARPLELTLESATLPMVLLKGWLPAAAQIDERSTARVSARISGTYAAPEIDAVVEAKNLRSMQRSNMPPADLRVTVAARDHNITLEGSAKSPDLPTATMSAAMPFRLGEWAENPGLILEEDIAARIDLPRVDLARYASLITTAEKVAGTLSGRIDVAGKFGKPEMKGSLALSKGLLQWKKQQVPAVTGISAQIDLTWDRITVRSLQATSAGGSLRGSGALEFREGKPGALDFKITGRHLPILRNESMIVRAHADLQLAGSYPAANLSGTVSVVDSLFYRDIEILPIGVPFTTPRAAALPRIDPPENPAARLPAPFADWSLDVRVHTGKPFLIRGNFASGSVEGDVRLRGTMARPLPNGEVRIRNMRAALPFSTLTVRSGTLRFTPESGFDPVLEIRGTSNPRPYRVNGYVYGRASDPQLVLTSSPPLPENEIMTLLATGTTSSGLEDSQAASSRALQLFAEELRRGRFGVGRQLRPLIRLFDRVDFTLAEADPYSNDAYSTATLSITDRWFLSAGIGEEGGSRVLAVWRLTFR